MILFRSRSQTNLGPNEGGERLQAKPSLSSRRRGSDDEGLQGLKGLHGSQGSQGSQGLQRLQGLQGSQGLQGLQGSQGSQGLQGLQAKPNLSRRASDARKGSAKELAVIDHIV